MPISDWLRRLILGEDEEPVQKFVPVPSFTPRAEPFDFPSSVALDNLGTDIEREVVARKPLTGPVDDRPRIGPSRAPTVEEKLAEIRSQTGVPEAPVITGPGDLARKQLELDQEIATKADPILQEGWDKAVELGTGVEDASMQGLQEIALHPQGLFGDAPARLVGSMLPTEDVGPNGMPLRDEEGRLQGFPLKKAVTGLLDVGTFQRPFVQSDIPQFEQEGFVPGVVQGINEFAGEALTDPSDAVLGAATMGLGGGAAKALSAMQFPALAESAKGAYENFENLPDKGLNTQTGKALASLVTQGAMAGAAGKQLGDIGLESVQELWGEPEGVRYPMEPLTDKALKGGLVEFAKPFYGDLPPRLNLADITVERDARSGESLYTQPRKELEHISDESPSEGEEFQTGNELEPVEPMETVSMDELYPDVTTDIPSKVRGESENLLNEAFQGKIADAFAEALRERPEVQEIKSVSPETIQEHANPLAAKTQEIASLVRSTLAKIGYVAPGSVELSPSNALGSVSRPDLGTSKGDQRINPASIAREIFIEAANNRTKLTPEQIKHLFIKTIVDNVLHETGHLQAGWSDTGNQKQDTGLGDSPLVKVDELGNISDTGQNVAAEHGQAHAQVEQDLLDRYSSLRGMVLEVFKNQISPQDVIDLSRRKNYIEEKVLPPKLPVELITDRPKAKRVAIAETTGVDPEAPFSAPEPVATDPIDHIASIRTKLRNGEAVDFQSFMNSLSDDLKTQGPDIWKEALGDPDKILATTKTPIKALINLVNARYPSGSKEAQVKILTKMIMDSKFLDQDQKKGILSKLPYHIKGLSGKVSTPQGPSGPSVPPKGPVTPPTPPVPNRFVKSSTDYIKYNQAIPVRQDQVAEQFQHLPKGMEAIHAYEANPSSLPDLKNFFDKLYKEQKDAGVQIDYTEDYLHHAYDGTPEQLKAYREWLDSQGSRSITLKPGHALHRIFDTYQEAIKFGLKPKFQSLADIAALYYGKARRAILDAELINHLKTTIDPKTGEPLLQKIQRPGYSPIVNFPGSRIPTKDGYVKVEYFAPTEIATQVNNFHSNAMLPLRITGGLASRARNLMLGAGIPGTWINMHGLNIQNRFAMSGVPDKLVVSTFEGVGDAVKMLRDPMGKELEQDLSQSLEEIATMIERGGVVIRPRRFYFDAVQKSLKEVLSDVTGTGLEPVDEFMAKIPGGAEAARKFGQAGQVIEHLFDKPLFERLVPYAMKQRYYEHLTELLNTGMDEQQAHETAGNFVNTMFGASNWQASLNTLVNNPNTQALLQTIILAPQWFGSNVKMMGKIPKSFFDNTSMEAKMYRSYAKKFMTLFILSQILGAGGTGGSEFQIPAGDVDDEHERQIRPFGTSQDWARLPFELLHKAVTRSDWDSLAKMLRNRMHPFVRSGLELITGKDLYTGQSLTGESVPEGRKLLNIGKVVTDPFRPSQVDASWELLKKVSPLGEWSEDNNLGRVKTLEEIGYDFTEAPVGVYKKKGQKSTPPFEPFNFNSRRKKGKKKKSRIEAP